MIPADLLEVKDDDSDEDDSLPDSLVVDEEEPEDEAKIAAMFDSTSDQTLPPLR